MTGMVLDGVLMLLLVAALGYGIRLEKKLSALRAGQLAFASAVTDLNTAAGRAEAALASLRASGHETDLLHDRIVKAREVKTQLEALISRSGATPKIAQPVPEMKPGSPPPVHQEDTEDSERALRMAALARRIQGVAPATVPARGPVGGVNNIAAILGALTANQTAKQSLNRARRSLDEDLFAA